MAQAEFSFSGEAHSLPGGRERAQRGVGPAERSVRHCWTIWETLLQRRSAGEKRSDPTLAGSGCSISWRSRNRRRRRSDGVELLGHHQHGPERCSHKGRDEQEDGRVCVNWRHRSSAQPCRVRSLNRPWLVYRSVRRLGRRVFAPTPRASLRGVRRLPLPRRGRDYLRNSNSNAYPVHALANAPAMAMPTSNRMAK